MKNYSNLQVFVDETWIELALMMKRHLSMCYLQIELIMRKLSITIVLVIVTIMLLVSCDGDDESLKWQLDLTYVSNSYSAISVKATISNNQNEICPDGTVVCFGTNHGSLDSGVAETINGTAQATLIYSTFGQTVVEVIVPEYDLEESLNIELGI